MDTPRENTANITPGLFYRYVFEGIKTDSRQSEIQIQTRKNKNRAWFGFIDSNPLLAQNFRAVLRQLQAHSLEDELFGNHEESVNPPTALYLFPEQSEINEKFNVQNAQYGFFDGENPELAQARFTRFFSACKLIADYIECNNDPENDLPYRHAYKILVISECSTGDAFASLHHLMKTLQSQNPLHDALLRDLPNNNPPLQDMKGWRSFIKKYGFRGLEIFQMGAGIEKITAGKSPADMIEARKIVSQSTYARYEENPELALLCKHYKLSEDLFNGCLGIDKDRKSCDRLPEVFVDGKDAGYPGYFLVKLPVHDPRKYLLGHITNCCQSIGGHSERCVIDLATLETSGAYVLLKGKELHPPILNGSINYRHFQIVGQAYAWLSKNNNLVLDSWENLRPEVEDEIITALLPVFGKKVTAQTPEIFNVNIGRGGKTPRALSQVLVKDPEVMFKGFQYGDSQGQSCIYFDEPKWEGILKPMYEKWDALAIKPEICRKKFFSFLLPGPVIDEKLQAGIEKYFITNNFFENFENSGIFGDNWKDGKFSCFFAIADMLDAKGFFNPKVCLFFLKKCFEYNRLENFRNILQLLEAHNLLSMEIIALLLNISSGSPAYLYSDLIRLNAENLLTFENCRFFISSFLPSSDHCSVFELFIFLRKSDLLTPENTQRIDKLFEKNIPPFILKGELEDLFKKNLLTEKIFMRLLLLDKKIHFYSATELLRVLAELQLPVDDYYDIALEHRNLKEIVDWLKLVSHSLTIPVFRRLVLLESNSRFSLATGLLRVFAQLQLPLDDHFEEVLNYPNLEAIVDSFNLYSSVLTKQNYKLFLNDRMRGLLSQFIKEGNLNFIKESADCPPEVLNLFLDFYLRKLKPGDQSSRNQRLELCWLSEIPQCLWVVFLTRINPDVNKLMECGLFFYLKYIPEASHPVFLEVMIKAGYVSLRSALDYYPETARLAFLIKQGIEVSALDEVIMTLTLLPANDHFAFLKQNPINLHQCIQTSKDLYTVLKYFPRDAVKQFLESSQNLPALVDDVYYLMPVLSRLPETTWASFIEKSRLDMKTIFSTWKDLLSIPFWCPSLWKNFLEQTHKKLDLKVLIPDIKTLEQFLGPISSEERNVFLGYFTSHLVSMIGNTQELCKILNFFSEDTWFSFLKASNLDLKKLLSGKEGMETFLKKLRFIFDDEESVKMLTAHIDFKAYVEDRYQLFNTILFRMNPQLWKTFLLQTNLDVNDFITSKWELEQIVRGRTFCLNVLLEIGLNSDIFDEYVKYVSNTPYAKNNLFQSKTESKLTTLPKDNNVVDTAITALTCK